MGERYTSGAYAAAQPDWHSGDAPAKAAGLLRVLRTWELMGRSVVELGCGTGEVLAALHGTQPQVQHTGFDIAATPLARAPTAPGLTLRHGDLLTAGVQAELGLALDVLEHLEDPVATLRALGRIAPVWVLRMPLERSWRALVRPSRLERSREALGHLHFWDWSQALEVVRAANFAIRGVRVDERVRRAGPRGAVERRVRRVLDAVDPRLAPGIVGEDSLWVYASPRT